MLQQSWLARALALVLALAVGLSLAALAIAHGHAHEHLAEARLAAHDGARHDGHEAAHDADAGAHEHGVRPISPAPTTGFEPGLRVPSFRAAGGPGDHAHPRLDAAVAAARADTRLDLSVALPLLAPVAALALPPAQTVTARLLAAAPPRAGPGGTPPPPTRAPPLG